MSKKQNEIVSLMEDFKEKLLEIDPDAMIYVSFSNKEFISAVSKISLQHKLFLSKILEMEFSNEISSRIPTKKDVKVEKK